MKLSKARLPTSAAAALAALLLLAPAALAQTAPWTLVTSPNASPGNNQLNAVASISANDVWAVGSADNAIGNPQPLAEHWDGTAWSIVPTPTVVTGTLSGVAAISSTNVWAGGGFLLSSRGNTAQFLHWNGRKWSVAKSPTVAGATIFGMAAVSSSDIWAVGAVISGGVAQAFIEHWNGRNWAVVASPAASTQNNHLDGVTAISASDVWAVGDFQNASGVFQTLTEQWNGTAWSIVTSPAPGSASLLNGVSADPASGQAWAVGNFRPAGGGATQPLPAVKPAAPAMSF